MSERDSTVIIGLGLIGGSIAKDLQEMGHSEVYAIDTNQVSLEKAIASGAIKDTVDFSEIASMDCTVVIAVPIDNVPRIALSLRDAIKEAGSSAKQLVIDVASVKKPISNVFSVLGSDTVEFVPTHPMAGTEHVGFTHARKNLFRGKPWIICPHENNSAEGIERTKTFVKTFGPHLRVMDSDSHDRQAAAVSHSIITLSNLIFSFVSEKHPEALELAGDGFSSTTRLASGNPSMHASILRANKGFVFQYVEEFVRYVQDALPDLEEQQSTLAFFESNMKNRNDWLRNRSDQS